MLSASLNKTFLSLSVCLVLYLEKDNFIENLYILLSFLTLFVLILYSIVSQLVEVP